MRASELITELQSEIGIYGDLEVVVGTKPVRQVRTAVVDHRATQGACGQVFRLEGVD